MLEVGCQSILKQPLPGRVPRACWQRVLSLPLPVVFVSALLSPPLLRGTGSVHSTASFPLGGAQRTCLPGDLVLCALCTRLHGS